MLRPNNMAADQKETKASENDLDPMMKQDMIAKTPVMVRMEYL